MTLTKQSPLRPSTFMTSPIPKILLVGDYWHSDFRTLITHSACTTTLVPTEQLSDEHLADSSFDLVILAAASRDQFSPAWVESVRNKIAPTPLIALLGAWCEGEQRSGEPWPGVPRIYWHQWQNRLDFFIQQFALDQTNNWQLPATANQADQIANLDIKNISNLGERKLTIGISAVSDVHFQMVADASRALKTEPVWIEPDQTTTFADQQFSLVVVDGDSWNQDLQSRINWLRTDLKINSPIVLMLNFPRPSDLPSLHYEGITEIVSKPFQLSDFGTAINRAINSTDPLPTI